MHNDGLKWMAYSAACRSNITTRLIGCFNEAEHRAVVVANHVDRIFSAPTGDNQILWEWKCGVLVPSSSQEIGWREKPGGTRETVFYYGGECGWMSLDEHFDARQKYLRTAP